MSTIEHIVSDTMLTAQQVMSLLPNKPHYNTIRNWRRYGKRGVKLPAVWVAGQWFYPLAGLQWFLDQQEQHGCKSEVPHERQQPPAPPPEATAD